MNPIFEDAMRGLYAQQNYTHCFCARWNEMRARVNPSLQIAMRVTEFGESKY